MVIEIQEFSALGLTTLRELILTRYRQRLELIDLLFSLGFHDKPDKVKFKSNSESTNLEGNLKL